ncbi:uncharacterized protein LOC143085319 [Mytilus galloprovincialis]|uniref:uncharacterized protein LOC143085319 n=1 Tax=Mytilus galloprovincialis TaxID=29158 RepID=UPI003F7C41D5
MKVLTLLTLCIVVVLAEETRKIRSTTSNHIVAGLNAGKEIASFFENNTEIPKVLSNLAKNVAPFLGVIGPLVSFIAGFFNKPGPSAELLAIQRLAKDIDRRFDKVDSQFAEVKGLIQWNTVKVQYSDLEQKINAVYRKYREMYSAPTIALAGEKDLFITNYESDFQNSGIKLYEGVLNVGNVFGDGLLIPCMKFTLYDRKKCGTFSSGILKLLLRAAEVELAYLQVKGLSKNVPYHTSQWKSRLYQIRSVMSHADSTIANKYHDQSGADIDKYALDHSTNNMNNHDFANNLYSFLAKKYYWRDWLVIAYKDVTGDDKHFQHECSGHLKFRDRGRNIVVASVDKRKSHMDLNAAKTVVNSVTDHTSHQQHRPVHQTVYHRFNAHEAYDTFASAAKSGCSPYAAVGVVQNGASPSYAAAPGRFVLRNAKYNHIHIFG